MRTHRCRGSLEARVSIRYRRQFDFVYPNDKEQWWLSKAEPLYEDSYQIYLNPLTLIKYCPFCGKEME